MDAATNKTCVVAGCIAACYIAYVVSTRGDGIALGTVLTALGGLAGYAIGRVKRGTG